MNGYTPSTPYETRIQNLLASIPEALRPQAISDAWASAKKEIENAGKFDFERHLVGIAHGYKVQSFVDLVEWAEMLDEHPVDREIDKELDGRTPEQDENIKQYFGGVTVTTSAEWRKRHL